MHSFGTHTAPRSARAPVRPDLRATLRGNHARIDELLAQWSAAVGEARSWIMCWSNSVTVLALSLKGYEGGTFKKKRQSLSTLFPLPYFIVAPTRFASLGFFERNTVLGLLTLVTLTDRDRDTPARNLQPNLHSTTQRCTPTTSMPRPRAAVVRTQLDFYSVVHVSLSLSPSRRHARRSTTAPYTLYMYTHPCSSPSRGYMASTRPPPRFGELQ